MANYYNQQPSYGPSANNLQFFPSSYTPGVPQGAGTPSQAGYGGYGVPPAQAYGGPAVTGRMGEQGGLTTGWLAAFSTEGYDGEPPLMEELGVNFGHIRAKVVSPPFPCHFSFTGWCYLWWISSLTSL